MRCHERRKSFSGFASWEGLKKPSKKSVGQEISGLTSGQLRSAKTTRRQPTPKQQQNRRSIDEMGMKGL